MVGGICDALQSIQPYHYRSWRQDQQATWSDVPAEIAPDRPLAFENDKWVDKILAERREPGTDGTRYEIELEW